MNLRCRLGWGRSSWPSYTGLQAANQFRELHRPEIPNIDPYVKLARQRPKLAVTMAMQIGPTFTHIPPGPEGIVAQDEVDAIDTYLGILKDALPAIAANDRGIVIVAGNKVFAAMQRIQKRYCPLRPLTNGRPGAKPHPAAQPPNSTNQSSGDPFRRLMQTDGDKGPVPLHGKSDDHS